MCGRNFSRARKCLKCGDDLPWLVYRGEITFAARRRMSVNQYKAWRDERADEKLLAVQADAARTELLKWLEDEPVE
jgi:hypothetical protein